jgi:hypothetical protein
MWLFALIAFAATQKIMFADDADNVMRSVDNR